MGGLRDVFCVILEGLGGGVGEIIGTCLGGVGGLGAGSKKTYYIIYGEVAMCSTFVILVTSLEWMRRNHFEIFYNVHLLMFVVTFVFTALHKKWQNFLLLIAFPLALWVLDVFYRVYCLAKKRKVISLSVVEDTYARCASHTP